MIRTWLSLFDDVFGPRDDYREICRENFLVRHRDDRGEQLSINVRCVFGSFLGSLLINKIRNAAAIWFVANSLSTRCTYRSEYI